MATFVLVHGAFHGGWCWDRLAPLLEAMGHSTVAPDLPGMGNDTRLPAIGTLQTYAEHVADIVRAQGEKPLVVGHSLGGATISAAGEIASGQIGGLIYLAAVLLPSGVPVGEMEARGFTDGPTPPMRMIADDAPEGCVNVHRDDIVPYMYHRTGAEGQQEAVARVSPQPVELFSSPIQVSAARWGSLRRAYIECTDDRIVRLGTQRRMQASLPCDPVIAIDSDHSPFFSDPSSLADALDTIARAWRA